MRILSLEMEGFGPFRSAQSIDFTQFDAEGLFVISGRTGAGKSTILDAICFALYDKVPRYDGTDKSVRSHFCADDDPTVVSLDYELHGIRYRVVRSPAFPRAKKRGGGTTMEKASASLYVLGDGEPEPIATMPREVAEHIATTVPLTGDQFLQVILLAQGRFAEFLKAETTERRALLRSLFGTQRFEDLEVHVRELARAASAKVEAADTGLDALVARAATLVDAETPSAGGREEFFTNQTEVLEAASESAAATRAKATKTADESAAALAEARTQEEARARLARARATLSDLEADAGAHTVRERQLTQARRAAPVAGPRKSLAVAERAVEAAWTTLTDARAEARVDPSATLALPDSDIAEASLETLDARASEIVRLRGALDESLKAERSLGTLHAKVVSAAESLAKTIALQLEAKTALEALPAEEKDLREKLDSVSATAVRLEDLAAAVDRAKAVVAAHGRLAAIDEEHGPAQSREAAAAENLATATTTHAALVRSRLASQAAHLAQDLSEGDPCPVCGSTTHPSPATPTDDHVTDEQVDAAYARVQAENAALDRARAARVEVEGRLATAREQAGDTTAEQAAASLESAQREHTLAAAASGERAALTAALEEIDARRRALTTEIESRDAAVTLARQTETTAKTELDGAEQLAAQRPDGYESVAEYADALDQAHALVTRLASAARAAADAASAAERAGLALRDALAEAGFESVDEAAEAEIGADDLAELERTVEAHRESLASAKAVVQELSARELPDEPADLESLESTAREAASARDAAVEAATAAASKAQQLTALRDEYATLGASTEAARAERDVVLTLADSLEGKAPNDRRLRLESFVLASKLERIVAAANARLETMSSGQYRLEHDDAAQYRNKETGLSLTIADAHTGRSRSTRSLSGGETFLASLSLALGLAETVSAEAGGIQLDTLFIDEGFGSLDEDTLEIAMATLEDLRDQGRTVGLISHVEAMKEAIPAKLEVRKSADGSSRVVSKPSPE
ncbi:AAA family ATPase [Demequina zhanjiangensis]|uniref:Nuclease SbcCD subunit C n=1 Tax=Demequina zhanjiangensis TaxID=3051659 RepID=A0ABT8G333_9MICO|nr:SMC family ATPase [Demequina sp. SYSU T00b26]MDN4473487.1 SMC family ATPase [Demequina sp. SYSU T00b26]